MGTSATAKGVLPGYLDSYYEPPVEASKYIDAHEEEDSKAIF